MGEGSARQVEKSLKGGGRWEHRLFMHGSNEEGVRQLVGSHDARLCVAFMTACTDLQRNLICRRECEHEMQSWSYTWLEIFIRQIV